MSFKWWPIRRIVQLSIIALIASPLLGLNFFHGNLAAGELFGIGLADPLAFLQATLASHVFMLSFLDSAVMVAVFYFLVGGRTFCSWICPVYLLTEMGEKLRRRLGTGERTSALSGTRWSFAATAVVSLIAGIPLFEILSPIGITTRAVMFKAWLPLLLVLAILVVEVCVSRRIWCRSLCPAGGFYALLGRFSPVRISFSAERCTSCGKCSQVCPVDEVLTPSLIDNSPQVAYGDCTRCGDCIDICPTKALGVDIWYK
jgi:ferredoxin-type protein NapH